MKSLRTTLIGLAAATAAGSMATAQTAANQNLAREEQAATAMARQVYVYDPATIKTPTQVVERLRALGYRDIRDFDVEYGSYEVEATTPLGRDVELDIDPVTGAITDIEDNWF